MKAFKYLVVSLVMMVSTVVSATPVEQMENYYRHKDLYLAKMIIRDLSVQKTLEKDPAIIPVVFGFIAGVVIEHPKFIRHLNDIPLSVTMKRIIHRVHFSTTYTNYDLDKYADVRQISKPLHLDTLWGLFYATGDRRIPQTIQAYVVSHDKDSAKNLDMTVLSAIWSLQVRAEKHALARISWYKLSHMPELKNYVSAMENMPDTVR